MNKAPARRVIAAFSALFHLRRSTSRHAGDNGLYPAAGGEEFTGSPGSNNSGDTAAEALISARYASPELAAFIQTEQKGSVAVSRRVWECSETKTTL